jgi:hypothetical protein
MGHNPLAMQKESWKEVHATMQDKGSVKQNAALMVGAKWGQS